VGVVVKIRIIVGLIAGLAISSSASATQIFLETFDGLAPAIPATTLPGTGFSVTGTVDVVAHGAFGISTFSGAGNVIDLDGSPGPGSIAHAPTAFAAGDKVTLSFLVGGSQRSSNSDEFLLGLTFGGAQIADVTSTGIFASLAQPLGDGSLSESVAGNAAYQLSFFSFTALTGGAFAFSFGTTSGDNIGPLLDNVGLDISPAAVPGPVVGAGLPGFIIALGALVALRRRRMAAA
jgi:hypothetical protein